MKAAHTPGPWQVHGCAVYTSDKLPNQIANRDPIIRHVGQACWDYDEDDSQIPWEYSEAYANARLIAAAPDLLEACKALLAESQDPEHPREGCKCPACQARTAIFKATEAEI